jgi:outer membrane protein assembly factor BamA
MKSAAWRVALVLLLSFFIGHATAKAESAAATETAPPFESDTFDWAYGMVIDSIAVSGNVKTTSVAILREMESRVGTRLEKRKLARDHRYLTDLSSLATVTVEVYPVREGRCGINLAVTERPVVFLKLVYPVVEYNFNNEQFRFGLKVNDRNFRRRLESFSVAYTRNSSGDDHAGIGWSTNWIGWQHIGLGAWMSYFNRGGVSHQLSIVEQTRVSTAASLPLTDSRIAFARLIGGLMFANNRLSAAGGQSEEERLLSPSLGFSLDTRDSPLRPTSGGLFFIDMQANRVVNGNGSTYYLLRNDIRLFGEILPSTVLAANSNIAYQYGKFPEYIRFGMGGAGTLRGYDNGLFEGNHRWIQSLARRITPFPTWVFSVPYAKIVDVKVSGVLFADGGITWDNQQEFDRDRWYAGYGLGLRVFSPFQDVVRVDVGFNYHDVVEPMTGVVVRPAGSAVFYFSTGNRF